MKKFMKKIASAAKSAFTAIKNAVKEAVENTKEVMGAIVCRSRLAVANNRAEGYVDSGVKILIAVVIGALLLSGLYTLFNTTIMPTVTSKITDLFNFKG
ncbi:MAG: hypothetical protein J6D10_08940 [Clostridia bacterium]|nr:hypothetical protein [Clostridia bacterium]